MQHAKRKPSRAARISESYAALLEILEEDARSVDATLKDGLEHIATIERMSRETLMLARQTCDQAEANYAMNRYAEKVLKRRLRSAERKRWLLRRTRNMLVRAADGRVSWMHALGGAAASAAGLLLVVLVF